MAKEIYVSVSGRRQFSGRKRAGSILFVFDYDYTDYEFGLPNAVAVFGQNEDEFEVIIIDGCITVYLQRSCLNRNGDTQNIRTINELLFKLLLALTKKLYADLEKNFKPYTNFRLCRRTVIKPRADLPLNF